MFRDTIINTVKFGIGEINNQSQFTLLMTFGNYPKSTDVGIRAGVLVIGTCYLMTEYLSCKVIFNYVWVKESTFQVLVCTLQWPPRVVVTNAKARSNACIRKKVAKDLRRYAGRACVPLGITRGFCIRRAVAGTNTEVETPSMWVPVL